MSDDREVSQEDCRMFFSEIDGALRGKMIGERSPGRIRAFLKSHQSGREAGEQRGSPIPKKLAKNGKRGRFAV